MTGLIGSIQQLETVNSGAVPDQVTGLSATSVLSNRIDLSWNAASGANTYKVERSTSPSSGFVQIANTSSTSLNATVLSAGTQYYFRVRGSNAAGDGAYSSTVSQWTKPGQVTGLSATAASASQINLSWNNPSGTETGYQVYRATNSSMSGQTLIGSPTGTTFSATGLSASTTYYFRVRAVNNGGSGTYSSIVNATTQAAGTSPTGVEIYHSNGGTIRTCIGECITFGSNGENSLEDLLTTDFSSSAATIDLNFNSNYSAQLNNNSGALTMEYYAYMTATGATSFEWDVYAFATVADRTSAISSWGATGTAATSQDGTSGLGENATLQHNSGGRGYLLLQPAFGSDPADAVRHKVRGLATNSNGTTSTSQLQVTWQVA